MFHVAEEQSWIRMTHLLMGPISERLKKSVTSIFHPVHIHEIRACYNEKDSGSGRYAEIDIEFLCGCTLSNQSKRIIAEQLKAPYGWSIILSSIDSVPKPKRMIRVKR